MNVTPEQLGALSRGQPIRVRVEDLETECVLVPLKVFEQLEERRRRSAPQLFSSDGVPARNPVEEMDPSFFEFDDV